MKTPEEYIKGFDCTREDITGVGLFEWIENLETGELIKVIKKVQKESWNEALDAAAESVDLKEAKYGNSEEYQDSPSISNDMGDVYYIDKQSILKLKKE